MPISKPRNAWSLVFVDGPLEGVTNRWNLMRPDDWVYTDDGNRGWVYRLKDYDEVRRVATMEVAPDA